MWAVSWASWACRCESWRCFEAVDEYVDSREADDEDEVEVVAACEVGRDVDIACSVDDLYVYIYFFSVFFYFRSCFLSFQIVVFSCARGSVKSMSCVCD